MHPSHHATKPALDRLTVFRACDGAAPVNGVCVPVDGGSFAPCL